MYSVFPNKVLLTPTRGLSAIPTYLSLPLDSLVMDFITGLPLFDGFSVILTVIDRFSKMVHLVHLKKLPSSKELSDILACEFFHFQGIPSVIVPNQGPQFVYQFC